MPVELEPPVCRESKTSASANHVGTIHFHPRYERFLRSCGIDSAAAALEHRGEIVCGHPDRHVVRCELRSRVVFIKREHVVGRRTRRRNRRAGFGPVSRCEREAVTLKRLEAAGLPGPQWMAYGDDGAGRAFLIVDELAGHEDCRAVLADSGLSPEERRELFERAGVALAELHDAGFGTPDLAAKHVLVNRDALAVTLVDWQSAPAPGTVSAADRVRQLAALDASLADHLISKRERLHFLRAYGRASARPGDARAPLRVAAKLAATHSLPLRSRSSTRDQLAADAPRLVWLAGEQVCVVPDLADLWPTPAVCPPFYPENGEPLAPLEGITFADGRRATLVRFRTFDPLGRLLAGLREKPWRSPASRIARLLFHLKRHGIAAPQLLGFGQRLTSAASAESFVAYDPPASAVPAARVFAEWTGSQETRIALLAECGRVLRRLHDARCRLSRDAEHPAFSVTPNGVAVGSPMSVRLVKKVTERDRRADLQWLMRMNLPLLSREDRQRIEEGYAGR